MQIGTQLRSAAMVLAVVVSPLSAWGSNLNYLFGYTQPGLIAPAASSDPLSSQSVNFATSAGTLSSVAALWGGTGGYSNIVGSSNALIGGVTAYSNLGSAWGSVPSAFDSFSNSGFGATTSGFASSFGNTNFSSVSTTSSFGAFSAFQSTNPTLALFGNGFSGFGAFGGNTTTQDFAPTGPAYPSFGNIGLSPVNTAAVTSPATTSNTNNISPLVVPEPSTWLLLFAGLGSIALLRRRAVR
jgi:hypothetical protein